MTDQKNLYISISGHQIETLEKEIVSPEFHPILEKD